MTQAFINVVIPFAQANSGLVDNELKTLLREDEGNRPIADIEYTLGEVIGTIHFMSITVVEPNFPAERNKLQVATVSPQAPSHLIIEISADGGTDEVLGQLAKEMKDVLLRLLKTAGIECSDEELASFLISHNLTIGAAWGSEALGQVFSGSPGQSVRRILDEKTLTKTINETVTREAQADDWEELSPRQQLDRIRNGIWNDGGKWVFVPEPAPCLSGDPANNWNPDIKLSNPQLWKAGLEVLNISWLIVPVGLIVLLLLYALFFGGGFWAGLALVLLLAPFLGVYLRLRHLERTEMVEDITPPVEQVEELIKVENFSSQNHLASVSRLKQSWVRRLTLRLAFITVGTGRFLGAPGHLGKNGVIHFARWMRLPGTDQLLFWSNFDGTWESYVGDFIADAPSGVSGIWSNCVGFPRTRNLVQGGAESRNQLVRWARRQQQPTRFWFSAYRDLTADRIRINAAIRQGLASAETDADARDWFNLFGSAPRPLKTLQSSHLSTLILGGLPTLPSGHCRVISFNDADESTCKQWLKFVAEKATYGELEPDRRSAVVVALTARGLRKLGVPRDAIETFPAAFQQDMSITSRARELGDVGDASPEEWLWGSKDKNGNDNRGDALLLVYGAGDTELDEALKPIKDETNRLGLECIHKLDLKLETKGSGARKVVEEPFGFADGVSQPVIPGTPRARNNRNANDVIEAGEIILGYPDNLGKIPPSPSIEAALDSGHLLADKGTDLSRRRPEFSRYEGEGRRDLGANGTFLVVRQLAQDRQKFDKWLDKAVTQMNDQADVSFGRSASRRNLLSEEQEPVEMRPLSVSLSSQMSKLARAIKSDVDGERRVEKEFIAAKLVGRWRNGTSLVRYPTLAGDDGPDNDFLLGSEDPRGLHCPFGAHIRRANPRDTRFQGDDSATEIASINRHRILRVGREYFTRRSDTNDVDQQKDRQGLLFMCLNADIERQFEFVQKTWILNRNIHGLEDEVDPILGYGKRNFTMPTASGPVVLEMDDDDNFVTMKGGGYFFLPGRATLQFLAT